MTAKFVIGAFETILPAISTRPAEAAKDKMDIRIKGRDDGRMCHDARSLNTGRITVWSPPQPG
jgi:hypothetical protein